jgi:hypothetical protein
MCGTYHLRTGKQHIGLLRRHQQLLKTALRPRLLRGKLHDNRGHRLIGKTLDMRHHEASFGLFDSDYDSRIDTFSTKPTATKQRCIICRILQMWEAGKLSKFLQHIQKRLSWPMFPKVICQVCQVVHIILLDTLKITRSFAVINSATPIGCVFLANPSDMRTVMSNLSCTVRRADGKENRVMMMTRNSSAEQKGNEAAVSA